MKRSHLGKKRHFTNIQSQHQTMLEFSLVWHTYSKYLIFPFELQILFSFRRLEIEHSDAQWGSSAAALPIASLRYL